jgi:hypothetical protein
MESLYKKSESILSYLRSLLSIFRLLADKGHKVGEGVVSILRVLCGTVLGGLVLGGRLLLVVAAGGAGAAEAGGGYRRPHRVVLRGQACGAHDKPSQFIPKVLASAATSKGSGDTDVNFEVHLGQHRDIYGEKF